MRCLYQYYQPNQKDKKNQYGDCVIRALSKAYQKTWLQVFDELVPLSRMLQAPHNSAACYTAYLKQHGARYQDLSRNDSLRPTVASFARDHACGTYFLVGAQHVVTVQDGCYFDSWDSGSSLIYSIWTIQRKKA